MVVGPGETTAVGDVGAVATAAVGGQTAIIAIVCAGA